MNEILQEYALLAVEKGVNIQKGQLLVINCPVEHYEFARLCANEAYKKGAGQVMIDYNDPIVSKMNYENVDIDVLKEVPDWFVSKRRYVIDRKCAFLHIISDYPGLLENIDSSKLQAVQVEFMKKTDEFRAYTMNSIGQWTIVGLPNDVWAKKVFPDLEVSKAKEKLLEYILKTSRVEKNKTISNWDTHNEILFNTQELLNKYHFEALHFKNSLGTDLVVGLNPKHIWSGGASPSTSGVVFNANIPTEEVFTMPKRTGVNGIVKATYPLNYQGKLIEDLCLEFKDGKVVSFDASKEKDTLANLLKTDENASYLGEVALISHNSPISNLKTMFYNTLYDENASCHLALGAAYPTTMEGGVDIANDKLIENECNVSMVHSDFMFGSKCMNIVGIKADGSEVEVMLNGDIVIK